MAPFTIGDRTFPTKTAAREAVRAILHGTTRGDRLTGENFTLIRSLLDLHPDAVSKIGVGVATLHVGSIEFDTPCFMIDRIDRSSIDFSYRVVFDGRGSARANLIAALRWEVQDQVEVVRHRLFVDNCELCGRPAVAGDLVDVDHADRSFAELAQRFIEAVGDEEVLTVEDDGLTRLRLVDRRYADIWQTYHLSSARLRVVHRSCHRGGVA